MLLVAALITLIPATAAVYVPPPVDVNVSCHNLHIMTTWKHDELQLPTSFRVKIAGSEGQYETTTQDPQYDLSHFILESVDRLMGFHYVNVTAVQEGHESNSVISQTFTFDILKTADITCKLDFPPVNMTVKDLEATVKFSNPIQFYKVLKRYSDDFDFTILQGDMEFNERCRADQMTCGRDFLLPEKQEQHCVRLRGEMTISGAVGSVLFRETELICAHEQTGPDLHSMILILLLLLLAVVICVIVFCVWKTRAWVMNSSTLPKSLASQLSSSNRRLVDVKPDVVSRVEINAVKLMSSESYSSLTVSFEEEKNPSEMPYTSTSTLHPPLSAGFPYVEHRFSESSNQELEAVELIPERREEDLLETERLVMDWWDEEEEEEEEEEEGDEEEEEESFSPYDRPHRLEVDMGDGDMVECYSLK